VASIKIPSLVEMDDGRELEIFIDQRDLAAYEAADVPEGQHTYLRFLAWSAMSRQKRYSGPWEQFNTLDCVEVADPPGAEEEDEAEDGAERLDPGPKDQSAAS
jgi:hypothetical protein